MGIESQETTPAAVGGVPKFEGSKGGSSPLSGYEEKRRGRGRPPGSGAKPRPGSLSDKPQEADTAGLDELYKGENWQEIAALPFNVRRAMTGSDVFQLDSKQKKILGDSLAASMKLLGMIDPKYVALTIFGVNITTIWAEKELIYALEKRSQRGTPETEKAV
ncbi:MAG: hypothetical protein EO766_16640 [Hydrotalea sp. AMD]|uniref:hypothetical protein n=1 Tax=Hydrotalea sp. AMD TaxID=2501297 RepID=UPI001026822E|nr:hypothetical protein [Hydrotalea sp. AMD]RWZ85539.1 MAG: hypothetical protein EO766_16640 [Hydrotalea sp. AMD]